MLIHASLEAMDFSQSFASQGICDSVQLRNRTESQSLETAQLFSGQALRDAPAGASRAPGSADFRRSRRDCSGNATAGLEGWRIE